MRWMDGCGTWNQSEECLQQRRASHVYMYIYIRMHYIACTGESRMDVHVLGGFICRIELEMQVAIRG